MLFLIASSLFSIKISFWFRRRLAPGIASLTLIIPLFAKNSRLGYFLTQITPHPSPLPTSGERGLDRLFFSLTRKNCRSFLIIWEKFLIYFFKKIVSFIPSPHKWGEGMAARIFFKK